MSSTIRDAVNATQSSPEIQAIMTDITSLKNDIATLANHIRASAAQAASSATTAARGEADHVSEEAQRLYSQMAAQLKDGGERSARAIGKQIEEQPVASLLAAFAIGFVASRVLSKVA